MNPVGPWVDRARDARSGFVLASAAILALLAAVATDAVAQESLQPGEAVVTRFSGTSEAEGPDGTRRPFIDVNGTVASVVDLRTPGAAPQGQHWTNEPQRLAVTAAEVGQVFGVEIGPDGQDLFLAATSAYGLHRNADNSGWMSGMWGPAGGPGTIYRLSAGTGGEPQIFAKVTLDGRRNSGAGLGNLAIDRQHAQLFVSDLETGMIHRLGLEDGRELGRFDHGTIGRVQFLDAVSGVPASLPRVPFDPASSAAIEDCAAGDFSGTPECWNFADFRRRVWGLAIRHDPETGDTRLFYATWGSDGFGNPDWAGADEDRSNTVWSVGIAPAGDFIMTDVRREFLLPDFKVGDDSHGASVPSRPVADVSFSACGSQDVMLVAERGTPRNLGLGARDAFAQPYEARVLRYELDPSGAWQLAGRYDIGFYDRSEQGPPFIRSNASGGTSFGPGFNTEWQVDQEARNGFVWITGDNLCTPLAACFGAESGARDEVSQVNGVQGLAADAYSDTMPDAALAAYPVTGPATPADAPAASYMIDIDQNIDAAGAPIAGEAQSRDATTIGSLAVYQPCPAGELVAEGALPSSEELPPPFDMADVAAGESWPEDYYPDEPFPEDFYPEDVFPGGIFPDDLAEWAETLDLAIEKTGPAECQEGGACTYTIGIRNAGTAPFFGPLALADTVPETAAFDGASAAWTCAVFGPDVSCDSDAMVDLGPGEAVALELTVTLPLDIADATVENCVAFDWDEMGFADREGDGNDRACASTEILERFDLAIEKVSEFEDCAAGSECLYDITITNNGPGVFNGPLIFTETLPSGATLGGASGFWGCTETDGEARCSREALELGAGEAETVTLRISYPSDTPDGPIEDCVAIAFDAMAASDGEADAGADDFCDTVDIHHIGYDLAITKAGPAQCDAGGLCRYTISITNNGPNDFNDILAFTDAYPSGSTVTDTPGPLWTCTPHMAPAITCETAAPFLLPAGGTASVSIEVELADPVVFDTVENCVEFDHTIMPDDRPHDTNDEDCVTTNVGEAFDLAIEKTSEAECFEGGLCNYSISITNNGPRNFDAPLAITDVLPEGAIVETVSDGWTCTPGGIAGQVSCETNDNVGLLDSASTTLTMGVRLPDVVLPDLIENCSTLDLAYSGYTDDGDAANNGPACVTTTVLEDVGLFGATSCERGTSCPVGVIVRNTGGRAFTGMFAVNGSFDPAVEILDVIGPNAGWSCSVTGEGRYRCGRTRPLRLEKRREEKISLVLGIPADFAGGTIVHSFWMVRPEGAKRDADASNDANASIITITGPAPELESRPEPTPEAQPVVTLPECAPNEKLYERLQDVPQGWQRRRVPHKGRGYFCAQPPLAISPPDLAVAKTASQGSCIAGEECRFNIRVTNTGARPYIGPLRVSDVITPSDTQLISSAPRSWSCRTSRGRVTCTTAAGTLAPGATAPLTLIFRTPRRASGTANNCAALSSTSEMTTMAVQAALNELGFSAGAVDGKAGPATRRAVRAYRTSAGLAVNGRIDDALLRRLFGSWGEGDGNAGNDRDCAAVTLVQREAPPPPPCTGGRIRNKQGQCVCPSNRPVWTGRMCTPRAVERTCPSGWQQVGRQRAKTLAQQGWQIQQVDNILCARRRAAPPPCTGGRIRNKQGQCVCPSNRPVWTGGICTPRAVQRRCPSGWQQVGRQRAKTLVQQGWQIRQVGNLLCARRLAKPRQQPQQQQVTPQ